MSPWVTLCLISHPTKGAVARIPNFVEGQRVWESNRRKWAWFVQKHSMTLCRSKMFICGLKKHYLLHSCVGCTADVTGNGLQAARMETGHHRSQIPVEPELKVFRPKACKLRSKGCQGHVQDGVSYTWIRVEGDISLQIKRFMVQCRKANTLPSSFWKWLQAWWHILLGVSVRFLSRSRS